MECAAWTGTRWQLRPARIVGYGPGAGKQCPVLKALTNESTTAGCKVFTRKGRPSLPFMATLSNSCCTINRLPYPKYRTHWFGVVANGRQCAMYRDKCRTKMAAIGSANFHPVLPLEPRKPGRRSQGETCPKSGLVSIFTWLAREGGTGKYLDWARNWCRFRRPPT